MQHPNPNICIVLNTSGLGLSDYSIVRVLFSVSGVRIQNILIRIRILLLLWYDPDLTFHLIQIQILLVDTDPDPYNFKEVMYLKRYFLYTLTWLSLSVGLPGPN
jgi:hypothetical protein